jgi:hypothetical protein
MCNLEHIGAWIPLRHHSSQGTLEGWGQGPPQTFLPDSSSYHTGGRRLCLSAVQGSLFFPGHPWLLSCTTALGIWLSRSQQHSCQVATGQGTRSHTPQLCKFLLEEVLLDVPRLMYPTGEKLRARSPNDCGEVCAYGGRPSVHSRGLRPAVRVPGHCWDRLC